MTKTERLALVKECRASGITAKAWCEAKGYPISAVPCLGNEAKPGRKPNSVATMGRCYTCRRKKQHGQDQAKLREMDNLRWQ